MNFFTDIASQLTEAFFAQGLSLRIETDHCVVKNSQNEKTERIRQILTNLNYRPLIFKSSALDNIKFTLVPYRLPVFASQKKENPPLMTSSKEQVARKETVYTILDDYIVSTLTRYLPTFDTSSIDSLLIKHLDKHFLKKHIIKVMIQGYRFVFIGDQHDVQCFRHLIRDLIIEVNECKDKSIALFAEACERNSRLEELFFMNVLKSKPKGLLYGLEKNEPYMLSCWVMGLSDLKVENEITLLLYHLTTNSEKFGPIWEELKKMNPDQNLRKMILEIEEACQVALTNKNINFGKEMLKRGNFYQDSKSWTTLLSMLIRAALKKNHFDKEVTTVIENFLQNPSDEAAFLKAFTLIQKHREPAMIENIQSVTPTLPKTTEIVVCIGRSHLVGIIPGLQKSLV